MEEILFRLLRCELWGQKCEDSIPTDRFVDLMELAQKQTVTGMVINPLADGSFTDEDWPVVSKYISRSLKIRRKNTTTNHELADFASICQANGIDYVVVKGQVIATCYPHPQLRMPGDIDFLICDNYHQVRPKLEQALNIHLPEKLPEKESAFKRNGILYELHTSLLEFGSRANEAYWKELIQQSWNERHFVTVDGVEVRTLPPTLNVVYVFCHLLFHFLREGIGLRQLCDLAVLLHSQQKHIDWKELSQILQRLDMTRVFKAFGTILTDQLGLPETEFPMPLDDTDRKWNPLLINEILTGGNFGKSHHKAGIGWRFKLETMRLMFKHTLHYYPLAPTETRLLIIRQLKINLRLLFNIAK